MRRWEAGRNTSDLGAWRAGRRRLHWLEVRSKLLDELDAVDVSGKGQSARSGKANSEQRPIGPA
jgi:hypothetical protein